MQLSKKDLADKYLELKEGVLKESLFTPEQKDMYLLGWLDCALYVMRKEDIND